MTVDLLLYPIDTIKTRLQSPKGFVSSGGFRGIYNGIGAVAVGSAPGAALFFGVYEWSKAVLSRWNVEHDDDGGGDNGGDERRRIMVHMTAASIGSVIACLVRVPTEVLKQNMQITRRQSPSHSSPSSLKSTLRTILAQRGNNNNNNPSFLPSVFGGLYRGYGVTLLREIPFSAIQFPLYERAKTDWSAYQNSPVSPAQAAACGSASGGVAAALTTPLDVVKTRLMIGRDRHGVVYKNAVDVAGRIVREEGWRRLMSGVEPRVMWMSIGGFVYFGAYENSREVASSLMGYDCG